MPLRCYIIGDDSLVIKCCKILLEHTCAILGVCSQDSICQEWATRHDIAVVKFQDFQKVLAENEFDYLFSISNRRILSAGILRSPKCLAINYHNALLPEYGGVYATAWAILEGKTTHGVTWHAMTEIVDGGNILLQATVPILPNDTMASLNTRCHAKAAETFVTLVDKIERSDLTPVEPRGKKSYYSLQQRVHHDALINWSSSAQEIDRLFRALQAGPYLNQLGLAKIIIANRVFIPRVVTISEERSGEKPGTIIKVEPEHDFFQCATTTNNIIVGSLTDIDGIPISVSALFDQFELRSGFVLSPYSPDLGGRLETFHSEHYKDEAFWVSQFRKACPVNFPYFDSDITGHSSSREEISGYLRVECTIRSELVSQLAKVFGTYVSIEESLFATVLMYIHKLSGYENFSVSVSNSAIRRLISGMEQFCSGYVPLNVTLEAEKVESLGFKTCIEEIKKQVLSLVSHGSYERDIFIRYHGLQASFPIAVCLYNRFEFDDVVRTQPKNYLTIYISGTKLTFSFNQAVSPTLAFKSIAEEIFGHITTLLEAGLKDDKASVVSLPILNLEAQQRLLREYQGRPLIEDKHPRLIDMFEEIAREKESREKIAIITSHSKVVTYYELDGLAAKLASYLQIRGATAGDVIAVSLEASVLSVAMLLAIMKLRATYLPLDPSYPVAQLRAILEDAKPKFLISRVGLSCNFATFLGKIVYVDQDWKDITTTKRCSVGGTKSPDASSDAAYIIYTSGTTGTPKGIMVSYRSLFCSMQSRFQSYEEAQVGLSQLNLLLLLSTSFDTSIAAILWPLLRGGKLILLNPNKAKSAKSIVGKIDKCNVSHIICVPALYRRILDYADETSAALKQPRLVILGGDTWDEELVHTHKKLVGQAFLYNEYGVSEDAISCMNKVIYSPSADRIWSITLGTPMPGVQIMVLDKYRQPVSPGITGELYLGGGQVAIGYVGLGQLTGERFIEYRLPDGKSTRLYKTGDLCCCARENTCGGTALEVRFKGRCDHQVKIRGFRIELQQIEHHISIFPNVKECVVTAREIAGEKHLVVYLVVEDSTKLEIDRHGLRIYLAKRLPDYMIPSFFMVLDKLPLSRNHKIDRDALPVPNLSERFIKRAYIRSRNPIEESLISIWTQLLPIKQIGVFDNFFELGGDSLLVTQLLVRVSKFFHTDISMSGFLETPTIAYLAGVIQGAVVQSSTQEKFDQMTKDSVLDERIRICSPPTRTMASKSTALLTGATGFLGIYLLKDLVTAGNCKIYCLIRAKTHEEAQAKLRNAFRVYQFDEHLLAGENVSIMVGDLEKTQFGLSDTDYGKLSEEVDRIYHCGAWVNHVLDYDKLRATNVLGTEAVLRLASVGIVKKVFYFSTVSAVSQLTPIGEVIRESFVSKDSDIRLVSGGYAQTKLVSEKLVEQATTRGIPIVVFRVCCWLSGDSKTGIVPTAQNHLLSLIKGCVQMYYAPSWSSLRINMLPIDIASKFVVDVTSHPETLRSPVYNIRNVEEISWTSFIGWMNAAYSFGITLIEPREWYEKLKELDAENAIYLFLPHYLSCSSDKPVIQIEREVDDRNTRAVMGSMKLEYPKPDEHLLRVYFDYLFSGFISPSLHLNCQAAEQMFGVGTGAQ